MNLWGLDTPTWQYTEDAAPRPVTRARSLGTLALPARRKWHPYPLAADLINRMEG